MKQKPKELKRNKTIEDIRKHLEVWRDSLSERKVLSSDSFGTFEMIIKYLEKL